jgi:putative transposase
MARPLRIDFPDATYHVTCRGNERRALFKDDDDRQAFISKLGNSLSIYGVKAHAYVLMTNHFHLVLQTPKANLSAFMRHFNVSYTGYFNRRHKRVGHLYHGRFKAILVETDRYLLGLTRYVHLNPVRIGAWKRVGYREQVGHLWRYSWSSLPGYVSAQRQIPWVTYEDVLFHCSGSRRKYGRFVQDGLETGYATPWKELKGQVVLGDEAFWKFVKSRSEQLVVPTTAREQPSLKILEKLTPAEIVSRVAEYFGLEPRRLERKRSGRRDERAILMELIYRHGRITQREVGEHLGGMDYTAVSHERRRLRERLQSNEALAKVYEDLERRLTGS